MYTFSVVLQARWLDDYSIAVYWFLCLLFARFFHFQLFFFSRNNMHRVWRMYIHTYFMFGFFPFRFIFVCSTHWKRIYVVLNDLRVIVFFFVLQVENRRQTGFVKWIFNRIQFYQIYKLFWSSAAVCKNF